jgi:hypothetical protein
MTATISAWKDTPTHTLDVGGTSFAYRQPPGHQKSPAIAGLS